MRVITYILADKWLINKSMRNCNNRNYVDRTALPKTRLYFENEISHMKQQISKLIVTELSTNLRYRSLTVLQSHASCTPMQIAA